MVTLTSSNTNRLKSASDSNVFSDNEFKDVYSSTQYNVKKDKNNTINPFINLIAEEVKTLSKKRREKFFNFIRIMSVTIIPLTVTRNSANAQTSTKPINIPFVENKDGLGIIPPEIFEILIQLIGGSMMIGSLIAILLLMLAGGYKMAGQSDKAKRWITEILKGLGIILLAPALIVLLVAITSLALSGIDGLNIFY